VALAARSFRSRLFPFLKARISRSAIGFTPFFVESYHSPLKRGIIGAFHYVSDMHLPRYFAEFDRRWNTRKERDGVRTVDVIGTAIGKRLMYKAVVR